jgi:hypothetical protein
MWRTQYAVLFPCHDHLRCRVPAQQKEQSLAGYSRRDDGDGDGMLAAAMYIANRDRQRTSEGAGNEYGLGTSHVHHSSDSVDCNGHDSAGEHATLLERSAEMATQDAQHISESNIHRHHEQDSLADHSSAASVDSADHHGHDSVAYSGHHSSDHGGDSLSSFNGHD